jgi:hypothetical protein
MSSAAITLTEETHGTMKKIKWAWTADSTGAVPASTANAVTTKAYVGKLQTLHTIGAAGSSAPTASWDMTIADQSSVDVTAGGGASRAAAVENTVVASLGAVANDTLTMAITGAGASNAGTTYLFIR